MKSHTETVDFTGGHRDNGENDSRGIAPGSGWNSPSETHCVTRTTQRPLPPLAPLPPVSVPAVFRILNWLLIAVLVSQVPQVLGQDLTGLIEQAPTVSMLLAKVLGTAPSFVAKVDLQVLAKADNSRSAASGVLEFEAGNLRWAARLEDVVSAQLTENARAVVKRISGNKLLLLTRSDQQVNYLVLSEARACLAQALPAVKQSSSKVQPGTETLDGHSCTKQALVFAADASSAYEVVVWRAQDLRNIPVKIQITTPGEVYLVRLKDVHFQKVAVERFQVPAGLAQYSSVEDLVQSVLLDKVKRSMGLE
jgi:hypothetical protein